MKMFQKVGRKLPKYVIKMFLRHPTMVVVKAELYCVHRTVEYICKESSSLVNFLSNDSPGRVAPLMQRLVIKLWFLTFDSGWKFKFVGSSSAKNKLVP